MTEHRCLNCNAPDAESYNLEVRSTAHADVYLCDECHDAILEEMGESTN